MIKEKYLQEIFALKEKAKTVETKLKSEIMDLLVRAEQILTNHHITSVGLGKAKKFINKARHLLFTKK